MRAGVPSVKTIREEAGAKIAPTPPVSHGACKKVGEHAAQVAVPALESGCWSCAPGCYVGGLRCMVLELLRLALAVPVSYSRAWLLSGAPQ